MRPAPVCWPLGGRASGSPPGGDLPVILETLNGFRRQGWALSPIDRVARPWGVGAEPLRSAGVPDFAAKTLTVLPTRVSVDGAAQDSTVQTARGERTLPLTWTWWGC